MRLVCPGPQGEVTSRVTVSAMHAQHWVIATVFAGLTLVGCSRAPEPVPLPEPSATESTAETDELAQYYEQELDWRDCGDAECTRITVPLDYSNIDGRTTELSVTRVPATGDAIGSLLVNPGGPGGSAFDYARAADYIVSPEIRESFDIVGVDPRGVAKSDPIRCLTDAEVDELYAADGTPDDATEAAQVVEDSRRLAQACEENAGAVWQYMDTTANARDMDIVRSLVGDRVLNYLGKSYGTAIGATYAELFPTRVGRMVLDGVLPITLTQEEVTFGQAVAFEESVRDFAADCADSGDCPFPGSASDVETALRDFLANLDSRPLPTDSGRELTQSLGNYAVLSFLYFPGGDYPRLRNALGDAVEGGDGTALLSLVDERVNRAPDGRYLDNSADSFFAVTCADMPYDGTAEDVARLAQEWRAQAPTFGESLAWGLLTCANWPVESERFDSVTAQGSAPILVVSTTQDPATPYQWGVDLARSLDNGHLITWNATNHTAYKEGSSCVDDAVDEYLLTGEVPQGDLSCE